MAASEVALTNPIKSMSCFSDINLRAQVHSRSEYSGRNSTASPEKVGTSFSKCYLSLAGTVSGRQHAGRELHASQCNSVQGLNTAALYPVQGLCSAFLPILSLPDSCCGPEPWGPTVRTASPEHSFPQGQHDSQCQASITMALPRRRLVCEWNSCCHPDRGKGGVQRCCWMVVGDVLPHVRGRTGVDRDMMRELLVWAKEQALRHGKVTAHVACRRQHFSQPLKMEMSAAAAKKGQPAGTEQPADTRNALSHMALGTFVAVEGC